MVAGLVTLMCLASPAHSQLIDRIYRFPSALNIDIDVDGAGNVYAAYTKPDVSDTGVWVSRLSPDLQLLGPEVPANTLTEGEQGFPLIGVNTAGHHVAIWASDAGIYPDTMRYRRFGPDGVPPGDEIVMPNVFFADSPLVEADGGFRFGFMQFGHHYPEGYYFGYYCDAADNLTGPYHFFAPQTQSGHMSISAAGQIWVESHVLWPDQYVIRGKLFPGETLIYGDAIDFEVPEVFANPLQQCCVRVTSDITENGESVVLWSLYDAYTGSGSIKSQRFGADGNPIGEIQSIHEGNHVYVFHVALFPGGDYVVAWVWDNIVHLKRYYAELDFVGPEFTLPVPLKPYNSKIRLQADPDRGHVFLSYTTDSGSEIVRIPILMPPVPVLFAGANATHVRDGVRLDWELSFDEAVEGIRIYRGAGGSTIDVSGGLLPNDTRTFTDAGVVPGMEYEYMIAAVRPDRSEVMSAPIRVSVPSAGLSLSQSVPNPFHDSARIDYSIDERRQTSLVIYDARGARVVTLQDGVMDPGSHTATWSSRDRTGRRVPTGVYFAVLRSGSSTLSRKMVIIR